MKQLLASLKGRVVLVAIASALAAGAVSTFYVSRESQREALRTFKNQQADEAEIVASLLAGKVDVHLRSLRIFAGRLDEETIAQRAQLQLMLLGAGGIVSLFDAVYVVDGQGAPLAAVRNGRLAVASQAPAPVQAALAASLAAPDAVMAPPVPVDLAGSDPGIAFVVVLRGSDGRVDGALAGVVPPQALLPASLANLGQLRSDLAVLARDGTILSHPDPELIGKPAADRPALGDYHARWAAAGSLFHQEGQVDDYGDHVVASAGVLAAQWMVVRTTARAVALGPIRDVQRGAWVVTAVVTALCALCAALLILRLAHPLTLLRERTVRGLDDNVDPEAGWPQATGEIGELARAVQRVMTENESRAQALRTAAAQLEALLANAPVGLFITRRNRIELAGRTAGDMLGYRINELQGQAARVIYGSEASYDELGVRIRAAFQAQGHFDGEVELRRKNGSVFWGHLQGRAIDPDFPDRGSIWIVEDITEAREAQRQLSWSATHDALTGLVNRREFEARLQAAMAQPGAPRVPHGAPPALCVLFIDLDHFKAVNDHAGHAAGDEVLRHVALTMESHVRQTDTVARLGGDEFAMLLPACPPPRALAMAERLRADIDAWRPVFSERSFALSLSVGLCVFDPATMPDVAAVERCADEACYAAKRGGRNRVVVYGEPALEGASPPA